MFIILYENDEVGKVTIFKTIKDALQYVREELMGDADYIKIREVTDYRDHKIELVASVVKEVKDKKIVKKK